MSDRLKRILIIVGFVLVTAALFFLFYLVFLKPAGPAKNTNGTNQLNGNLPTPRNGNANTTVAPNANGSLPPIIPANTNVSQVSNGGVTQVQPVAPTATNGVMINPNGTLQYYDKNTGQFFTQNPGGAKTLLSPTAYKGANAITWSPDGKSVIMDFPDGSHALYNFTTQKQSTLPSELHNFSFSPSSDQVVSRYLNAKNPADQWLMVSKSDGTQAQSVEQLGENANRVTTAWSPNNQIIATYYEASNGTLSTVYFLGALGQNFDSVTVEGLGFIPLWAPDGRRLVFSTYSANNQSNPHLYIMNGTPDNIGTNMIDLGLDTRADKCVFSPDGQSLYCAVPYYLREGSGPQPSLSADIPDNIFQINLQTGTSTMIAQPVDSDLQQRFSATSLRVSADGKTLYFVDALTGQIEQLTLR